MSVVLALGVQRMASGRVLVYTSADDVLAKEVLAACTRATGVEVVGLFDTEATKTTALESRIRAERDRPRADIFWSSEGFAVLRLARDRLLGGRKAAAMPAYASGGWADAANIGQQLLSYVERGGFKAVKMRVGVIDGPVILDAIGRAYQAGARDVGPAAGQSGALAASAAVVRLGIDRQEAGLSRAVAHNATLAQPLAVSTRVAPIGEWLQAVDGRLSPAQSARQQRNGSARAPVPWMPHKRSALRPTRHWTRCW